MKILSLFNMLQVCDSLFPVGSYTLSGGLETFVQQEKLRTSEDLLQYLKSYLTLLPYQDLGAAILAYQCQDDKKMLLQLDALYSALRVSAEMRKGSEKLCRRFLKIINQMHNFSNVRRYEQLIKTKVCNGHYAIAVGLFIASNEVEIKEAAAIYAYSLVSTIVTNAVKTVPLSQMDGQQVLNESFALIKTAVEKALNITVNDLGIGGTEFEIAAMNHETLYSRLYMS